MKGKIIMMVLLCALLVGLVPPGRAHAEIEYYVPENYSNQYVLILYNSNWGYKMFVSDEPFYVGSNDCFYSYTDNGILDLSGGSKLSEGCWVLENTISGNYTRYNKESYRASNHNIYYGSPDAVGELYKTQNIVTLPVYSFETWCYDAGLNCSASANESSSVVPFWYEPDNYNYIVSKNLNYSITSGQYNLLMIQKGDGSHYPYKFSVGEVDYLGLGGSFSTGTVFTVRKFYYDSDGEGWKLIQRYDVSDLPYDLVGFVFDENTPFIYSDIYIYADRGASAVWQYASTEYYNVDVPEEEIPTVPPSVGSDVEVPKFDIDWNNIGLSDIPDVIAQIKDAVLGFFDIVGVVPLMIGAVFGFLPPWCLWMFGLSFALLGVLLVIKLIRG